MWPEGTRLRVSKISSAGRFEAGWGSTARDGARDLGRPPEPRSAQQAACRSEPMTLRFGKRNGSQCHGR